MIKLYTDNKFLTETYRSQVFPLLFDLVYKKSKVLSKYYTLVSAPQESDVIVVPINYSTFFAKRKDYENVLRSAKLFGKPLWVYTAGDYGYTTNIPNSFTFRLGGFETKMSKTTFILPSFINDPYSQILTKDFSVLPKEDKPSIGFVGHAKSGIQKYIKEYANHVKHNLKTTLTKALIDKQSFYPSSIKRARYLKQLAAHNCFNTQFILRDSYRAGVHSTQAQQKSTLEFYTNIYNTAYTFCIRGVGNFSVRLYETLAVGRIPILFNTDCRLPLHKSINWSKHCLILDNTSPVSVKDQILAFHNNLNKDEFEALQKSNRNLWLNTLQRESYFIQIHQHFKSKTK